MTVLRQVIESASDATLKGRAINVFGDAAQGANDTAILDLNVGALVAGETFSLGDDVFEWADLSTAETATGSAAAAGTPNITLDVAPDRDFEVGEVFAVDVEYCKVTSYVAGSLLVGVERGYAGSTAAVQAADIILRQAVATPQVNGNILIPVDDGTQAEAETKTVTAVPALRPKYGARDQGTNAVEFDVAFSDAHPANSLVSANSNTLANFAGGSDSGAAVKSEFVHAVDAADASAGTIIVTLPFAPSFIDFKLFSTTGVKINETVDAAGVSEQNEPTAAIVGRVVTFTEDASHVFVDGEFLLISAYA